MPESCGTVVRLGTKLTLRRGREKQACYLKLKRGFTRRLGGQQRASKVSVDNIKQVRRVLLVNENGSARVRVRGGKT